MFSLFVKVIILNNVCFLSRCELGLIDTGTNIQECLIICTTVKQCWRPCKELSATDSGSLRHAKLPSTTDRFCISFNKKSLTTYLWPHIESKWTSQWTIEFFISLPFLLIMMRFVMHNIRLFCLINVILLFISSKMYN